MALGDNDGALVCRKDGPLEMRSMFVLHERSPMGQFTRSIGHEILRFTVTVISLSGERWLHEIDEVVLMLCLMSVHCKNAVFVFLGV